VLLHQPFRFFLTIQNHNLHDPSTCQRHSPYLTRTYVLISVRWIQDVCNCTFDQLVNMFNKAYKTGENTYCVVARRSVYRGYTTACSAWHSLTVWKRLVLLHQPFRFYISKSKFPTRLSRRTTSLIAFPVHSKLIFHRLVVRELNPGLTRRISGDVSRTE
jgi:hypothetical protein